MEIDSDDGGHDGHSKAAAVGVRPASTDPRERLLPASRPESPPLPGGVGSRERRRMLLLFSLTAALLYAGEGAACGAGW